VVFKDPQIGDRMGERVAKPGLYPAWRKHFFAVRFRKVQFALPDPRLRDGKIVDEQAGLTAPEQMAISERYSPSASMRPCTTSFSSPMNLSKSTPVDLIGVLCLAHLC
jgi:hypothetical protein